MRNLNTSMGGQANGKHGLSISFHQLNAKGKKLFDIRNVGERVNQKIIQLNKAGVFLDNLVVEGEQHDIMALQGNYVI